MTKQDQIPYFTSEELKGEQQARVHEILSQFEGDVALSIGLALSERAIPEGVRSEAKILDCGTASGAFPLRLYEHGFRNIYATDIDDYQNSAVLKSGLIKEFVSADLSVEKLPWNADFFDLVTAWCVLPHLENPFHVMREIHRVLKPEGYFIFSMPHIGSLRTRKRYFLRGDIERFTAVNNHIAILTPAILTKMTANYFEIVTIEYDVHPNIYKGRFGWLKKIGTTYKWSGKKKFKRWFGNDSIYMLKKRPNTLSD
jgi:2-polyprenyl-3-methyl-5-hydroxy-6-metoxy-1,4-benzoquinol methylase